MNKALGVRLIPVFISGLLVGHSLSAQTDEEQVFMTMKNWKAAVLDQDIDGILEFYSRHFVSNDANGREELRLFWEEVISMGRIERLEINLAQAEVEIIDGVAEFVIYDEKDEILMDFYLEKEEGESWLITGIPSDACSFETYSSPYGDDCVRHQGYYRCWDIYVSAGLEGDVPLVIDIHGWGDHPSRQRSISGFESLASSEGFIVAWPYGLCDSWNSGELCCPPASEEEIDDVGFIRKMIAKISEQYSIDPGRIYVTGLSNGCAMAQRLANEASDRITAAACISLHLLVSEHPGYSPTSVMAILGTEDGLYYADGEMPGAMENFETWKKMNRCSGTYNVTWSSGNSVAWTYENCENGAEVSLVTIDQGGHILYQGEDTEINTTRLAWDFMKRFNKF
jgi:polyhydroxybutyrate depolymerase